MGVQRRRPRAGAARRVVTDQHGVHPVPPDRDGLAAVGEGHPRHRGCPRRRRSAEELRRQALHVQLHPAGVQRPVRRNRSRGRPVAQGQRLGPPDARSAAPRRSIAGHQRRGEGGPRHPARRRLPRYRLADVARGDQEAASVDVPPVPGAGRGGYHQGRDGSRTDLSLRDGWYRGRPGHRCGCDAGAVRRRRVFRRNARLQSSRWQLTVRSAGVRSPGRTGCVGLRTFADESADRVPGRGRGCGQARSGALRGAAGDGQTGESLRPARRVAADHE